MARVIFMCGPAGSGKSTVARQYERQGMTRLSFDQEAWSRGITTMPLPEDVHRDIEATLRARLEELVRAGSDVVLDFSFWSRRLRDDYRALLRPLGAVPETVYLATDRATVLQRIGARAAGHGRPKTKIVISNGPWFHPVSPAHRQPRRRRGNVLPTTAPPAPIRSPTIPAP